MTATEELRRLLDERGVKWWSMHDIENGYYQDRDTEFVIGGKKYTAHEWGGTLNVYGLTPEQAIAATLGRGVDCSKAEHDAGGCLGFSSVNDDEPVDQCKACPKYTSYEVEL